MSKMRLKPATIGVVRSCAMPQAVKQKIRATNSTSMPRPISGWLCVLWGSPAREPSAMVLMRFSSRGAPFPDAQAANQEAAGRGFRAV